MSDDEKSGCGCGCSFIFSHLFWAFAQVILIVLKLIGAVDWSWWWVFFPMWFVAGAWTAIFILVFFLFCAVITTAWVIQVWK